MDPSSVSGKGPKKLARRANKPANPQLFNDISQPSQGQYGSPQAEYYGGQPQAQQPGYYNPNAPPSGQPQPFNPNQSTAPGFPGQQYLNDPMANMAMQYGGTFAEQGKEYMQKNIEKYVSTSKMKYYFAVDTAYVGKKLALLIFPFSHTDWAVPFNQDEPVAPRFAVNAPDLYIPLMGFVTFVLLSAVALGTQGRFTPETLGMLMSSALGWLALEVCLILLALYLLRVSTSMSYLDWTAYCGYKYIGMVLALLGGVFINTLAYYILLGYTGLALAFFVTRSLKVQILPHTEDLMNQGNKRRLYVLLTLAAIQPLFMWWLTFSLVGKN